MLNLMLILFFQSLLLQIGQSMLEQESLEVEERKRSYMEEKCPPLNFPHSMQELQVKTDVFFKGNFDKQDVVNSYYRQCIQTRRPN